MALLLRAAAGTLALVALLAWAAWPAGDELATLRGVQGAARAVAFSPDGARLAAGGDDGAVRVWDVAARRPLHTLTGHAGPVRGVTFARERLVSAGDDGTVRFWNADGAEAASVAVSKKPLECVAASADGQLVAAGGAEKRVFVLAAPEWRVARTLTGHADHVHGVAFAPDGQSLVSAGERASLRHWDAATGKLLASSAAQKTHLRALAVSPDGKSAVAATGKVRRWSLPGLKEQDAMSGPASVRGVAIRADGRRLATCHEDRLVRVWDAESGALVAERRGHRAIPVAVAFSPDGRTLATAGADGAVMLWGAE